VSNKKDKHALAASDKRPIRLDLTRSYIITALWPKPISHPPHLPTLTHVVFIPTSIKLALNTPHIGHPFDRLG
jgi:hypothetical protein